MGQFVITFEPFEEPRWVATRFAGEMAPRLGINMPIALLQKSEFVEPMVRIDTDRLDGYAFGWSEAAAWDAEAEFYKGRARF